MSHLLKNYTSLLRGDFDHPRLQYFLPYKTQFTTLAYSMPVKWPLGFSHPTFCLSASFNHNVEDIIQLPQMSYFDQSLPYHTKELVILFRELYQEFFFFFLDTVNKVPGVLKCTGNKSLYTNGTYISLFSICHVLHNWQKQMLWSNVLRLEMSVII